MKNNDANIPANADWSAAERGTLQDELMVALVRSINDGNAVLDDSIHATLQDIKDELATLNRNLGGNGELVAALRGIQRRM